MMMDAKHVSAQARRPGSRTAWKLALIAALAMGVTGLTLAVGNPGYLTETTVSIPAGTKSYQAWYTTDCDGAAGCDCDSVKEHAQQLYCNRGQRSRYHF
jgi:hypothetical protein